jgi:hypothetical protein
MSTFYNDVILPSPYFKLVSRIAYPEMLEPTTREMVEAIMADAKEAGITLRLNETYRSAARQARMMPPGNSKVDAHHYGLAADLVQEIDGKLNWSGDYTFLGALANKHGMVWGGPGENNLNTTKVTYVQRIKAVDEERLFNGSWYPDSEYKAF